MNQDLTSKSAYPEILEDLRTFLLSDLQKMGLQNTDCERIALALTERIRTYWGGEQIYLAKGRVFSRSKRDEQIEAEFDQTHGRERRELRKRYGLTERQLYRIVNEVRSARARKLRATEDSSVKH